MDEMKATRDADERKPADRAEAPRSNIALGLERIGLVALRAPALTVALALLLALGAVFGVQRIRVDDSLSQLFRSDSAEFHQFEQISREFPSSEYDVLVAIEGKALLERDTVEKLRVLVADLQLAEGARGAISMFSAREPAKKGGLPTPLFPDPLPEGAAYQTLVERVLHNEIIRDRLMSGDGDFTLIVLSLEPKIVDGPQLGPVVEDIRGTLKADLKGAPVTARLSGAPVMQLAIRDALERDRILYNGLGLLAGCVIAIFFFRRVSFMVIAAAPPLAAILLALGALGWLGFQLNMFLNVMTPLIMVISFSDSMQVTFAARDEIMAGADPATAFANAVRVVGPACVLTHAAAGLSMVGLFFSSSDLIRAFGYAGALSILIALVAVLTLIPALGVLLAPNPGSFTARGGDGGVQALRRFCRFAASRLLRRPALNAAIAVVVVVALGWVYSGLTPRFRLVEMIPDQEQVVEANQSLDAKLAGANPIDVYIAFPPGKGLFDPDTLQVVDEVHRAMESQPGIANVWSLATLRRWLAEKTGHGDVATLRQYVDLLPTFLVRRFIAQDRAAVVIAGRVPDKDAGRLLPIVNQLNGRLDDIRARHPGFTMSPNGLSVIAAHNSAAMISKLNRGLTVEFAFVAAFIGLAFRSIPVALSCLPSGVFPVFAAGALLRLLGEGLQFASIVALIVSFGLGLSATIHFLNRMQREDDPQADPSLAVARATVLIGPALILTALVLACGLGALAFSNLPILRLFGWLSAFAMVAALAADLLILRPTIAALLRLARRAQSDSNVEGERHV